MECKGKIPHRLEQLLTFDESDVFQHVCVNECHRNKLKFSSYCKYNENTCTVNQSINTDKDEDEVQG